MIVQISSNFVNTDASTPNGERASVLTIVNLWCHVWPITIVNLWCHVWLQIAQNMWIFFNIFEKIYIVCTVRYASCIHEVHKFTFVITDAPSPIGAKPSVITKVHIKQYKHVFDGSLYTNRAISPTGTKLHLKCCFHRSFVTLTFKIWVPCIHEVYTFTFVVTEALKPLGVIAVNRKVHIIQYNILSSNFLHIFPINI